jgi:nicotinate-nucleotide--dimethylbenzimidazole phosphoribosyltransferase
LAAWLLDKPVSALVGRGTGVDDEGMQRKMKVIEMALAACHAAEAESDWLDGFARLGGFELAAIAGAMLAGAARRVPTLLDGLMTGVAALWATKMAPALAAYLLAGHLSPEPAHKLILAAIGCQPLLTLSLRVGEGTGALFAWPILASGLKVMAESATFADARVTNPHQDASADEHVENIYINQTEAPVAADFSLAEREAVYKAILARRDIRVFLPQPLDSKIVTRILQAGHHGPSVGYMQPWNFIVIEDKDVLLRLQHVVDKARVEAGRVYADAKRDYYLRLKVEGLVEAPLTICVTNDSTRGGPHVLGRHTIPETDLMSTACAIENMWLAARAEGVAMGWVSIYEKQDVRDVLSIPAHVDPCALLTLGYTPHFPDIPVLERVGWGERLQLDDLIYQNEWGALPEK